MACESSGVWERLGRESLARATCADGGADGECIQRRSDTTVALIRTMNFSPDQFEQTGQAGLFESQCGSGAARSRSNQGLASGRHGSIMASPVGRTKGRGIIGNREERV